MKTLRMPKISKQRFNDFNAVNIAAATLLIALTTFLQLYASALTDQYRRIAQQHSVERTEVVLTGTVKYNYDYFATYKTWTETRLKQETAKVFDKNKEALRLQTLAKELEAQSPVFKAGYVEGSLTPDWADYKATLYSYDATRLREMFLFEKKLESYTNAIADELVLQITILAVAIAFFGLAVSMSVRTRNLFVVLGYVIVTLCTIWLSVSAYQLYSRPTMNMPAIQAFSRGEAARESRKYDEARFAYDAAIKADPQYAHAYFKRSLMHFNLERIDSAVADMLMAHRYGMADEGNAELGLMYYLNANFQEAIQHNQKFLDSTPDDISLLASQFLNYLLLGDYQKADETLSTLLILTDDLAKGAIENRNELPTSFWMSFDSLATDLSRLEDLLNGGRHKVLFTPPRNKITIEPKALSEYIRRTYTRLREKELEYSSGNPSKPTQFPLTVNTFVFGDFPRVGDDFRSISASEQFQGDTNEIWVKYSIDTKVQQVNSVTWRLYHNNNELIHLRTSYSDVELSSREYMEPFAYDENYTLYFPAGDYRLEMYVNGTLSQSGTFSIATESE